MTVGWMAGLDVMASIPSVIHMNFMLREPVPSTLVLMKMTCLFE